ncbi:MAG: hypothetical protein EBT09_13690, partial [Actinobacteria bacterium]|nr:hypothetical protein [Actinomycetota bacterium]
RRSRSGSPGVYDVDGGAPTDASGEVPREATHAAARRTSDECTRYVRRTVPGWPADSAPLRLTDPADAVARAGTAVTDGTRRDDAGVPVAVTTVEPAVPDGTGDAVDVGFETAD